MFVCGSVVSLSFNDKVSYARLGSGCQHAL